MRGPPAGSQIEMSWAGWGPLLAPPTR